VLFPLLYPAVITSSFGERVNPLTQEPGQFHYGIDLGCPVGTPVVAPLRGTVQSIWSDPENGNALALIHDTPEITRSTYSHLTSVAPGLRVGQMVFQGGPIAVSGNTGMSTGPHMHFHLDGPGGPIDPEPFLRNPDPAILQVAGISWQVILTAVGLASLLYFLTR
jgi:murein DD-endopeptidase MepM/ murein hydrolase activator NlpD